MKELAIELFRSLNPETKRAMVVDYDHPMRQYHNRGVSLEGPGLSIGLTNFSWRQLGLVNRLFYAGLSEEGRTVVPKQQFLSFGGLRILKLLLVGDPGSSRFQAVFSGPHLNLRLGGMSREGVAFGGPIVYGDQRGNNEKGLPGNIYRRQFEAAHEIFSTLTPSQKKRALLPRAPIQTQIEYRGSGAAFAGAPVATLSDPAKRKTASLIDSILRPYEPDDVAYARRCLERNGGVEALSLSFYRDGEVDGSGQYQIFRLEGPGTVLHFRGFPHVHAFINVTMDGERPFSVGEELGENHGTLAGARVKSLFEAAMRDATGEEHAYYPLGSVVGRLRPGLVRTGDIYNLESWAESIRVVSVRGRRLEGRAPDEWTRSGFEIKPATTYRIATTGYVAEEELRASFGRGRVVERGGFLRDATIAYLRHRGFPKPSTTPS